ncbi:MAG: hypothetical protein KGL39_09950 [Patescibacteria group bacterium]|nr:hypothetical protein [Patescibacteria group bacterium]
MDDSVMDELLFEANGGCSQAPAPRPGGGPAKVRYTHDAMIDLIIQNPGISQGHLAIVFGYTQSWVSIILASDAFQARLAARRDELVDPAIRASVEERFRAVVFQSLQILSEKLAQPALQVPDNLVLRAAELGAKALGVGGNAPPPAAPPAPDHLEALSKRLVSLMKDRQGEVYEAEEITVTCEPVRAASGA